MATFAITGKYTTTGQSFCNGVYTTYTDVANISEVVVAKDIEEASQIASNIFACYEARGDVVTDRKITSADQPEVADVAEAVAVNADQAIAIQSVAATPAESLRCKKCGTVGKLGQYPFSTAAKFTHLCDDCGA